MTKKNYWPSYDFINQLIEQVPAAIFWKDKNSVFLGCNRFFANLAAINDPKQIIGKTDYDLPWGKFHAERYIADDQEIIRTQIPKLNIEEIQILDDGQEFVLLSNKIPLLSETGEVFGILAIFHDITRRKKMELSLEQAKIKAEMANHAKSEFIANMSHDIRTPLTGVIGLSFHLYEQLSDPHSKQVAKWIVESAEQLLALLNSILDLVNVDNTQDDDLKFESFNLKVLIDELIQLHLPASVSKGIELKIKFANQLPQFVVGDRAKLYRILLNLFSNAIKFTEEGSVQLEVEMLKLEHGKGQFQFTISDTGIGIPPEQQPYVFERFYRAHPSYKGLFKGHGLGLHIAKKYVELMDGVLQLTSRPNEGTNFYFDVWLNIADEEHVEHSYANQQKEQFNEQDIPVATEYKLKMMLVEDNKIAQKMIEIFCKNLKIELDVYESAGKAFEAYQNNQYQLIITDIGLPDCSGHELAYMIRQYEAEHDGPTIPIIGLTAHAHSIIQKKCLAAGMQDVLNKPISKQIISDMIAKHCSHHLEHDYSGLERITDESSVNTGLSYSSFEEYPLYQMELILKRFGTKELLHEMLNIFIEQDLKKSKGMARMYFEKRQYHELKSIVHKIRGGAVYCGTERLQQVSKCLEIALCENDEMTIRNLFPIWHYVVNSTIHDLELYTKSMMDIGH